MNDEATVFSAEAEINDSGLPAQRRLSALSRYVSSYGKDFPPFSGEINNHIHTIYSFSPYTPSKAALMARMAGLSVAGSVDHDSIGAAREMRAACDIAGIGCVTGFELRVSFRGTPFAETKLNNPDSAGIAYMTVQGVPEMSIDAADVFLRPLRTARHARNRKMLEVLNGMIRKEGLPVLDYDRDVLPSSKSSEGGGVTERHILYAFAKMLEAEFGRGAALTGEIRKRFSLPLSGKIEERLLDSANPHYVYDLLGVLKSGFMPKFFIQPGDDECIPAKEGTAFARGIGAVPAYAYLGDVGESPTGDKKAEKFEDSYLDDLFPVLRDLGYLAVAYMPPRNTLAQLLRVQKLCREYGLMEISGVDINSSRQSFNCPEMRKKEFSHLADTTYALVAHEKLSARDLRLGLFSPDNQYASEPLETRIARYAALARGNM